jgi:hypothetical protein
MEGWAGFQPVSGDTVAFLIRGISAADVPLTTTEPHCAEVMDTHLQVGEVGDAST